MKRIITIIAVALALTGSAFAQSPREGQSASAVSGGKTRINHSLKSRGRIGQYEIVVQRERGLFGPSTVTTFLYNTETGSIAVINPANSPGVGIAAVNGGALAGASYLFGASRKADTTSVNSGSTATASGSGTATGGTGNTHNNNNGNQHNH